MAGLQESIDVEPPPAVKSLRSKFEQLALDVNKRPPPASQDFLPDPNTARPRASLNSPPDTPHLHASSSSSDLKVGIKRPPPPPPPLRPPNIASPSSPLLRPVPVPNTAVNGYPHRTPIITSALVIQDNEDISPSPSDSVASLRNKFTNPSFIPPAKTHLPKRRGSGEYPPFRSDQKATNQSAPAIPPRPTKTVEPSRRYPLQNPQVLSDSSSMLDVGDSESDASLASRNDQNMAPWKTHHHRASSGDLEGYSSRNSDENNPPAVSPGKSPRPGVPPPPRPPPRPKAPAPLATPDHVASPPPPPLPVRRSPHPMPEELSGAPPLPVRPIAIPYNTIHDLPGGSAGPSKALGANKLPPPPTRTIAPGDKLPPARRPTSPSSGEESGDEDDSKVRLADSLPDSSHSSRRPPVLSIHEYAESQVQVPAYAGHVAVFGEHVVAAMHHHVKFFNLSKSDSCLHSLDGKDVGLKDFKATCLEFRPAASPLDRGFLLWLGTKEGHLLELDTRTLSVVGTKFVAHSHPISHIFHHGRSMITLDHSGKALIFTPEGTEDVRLGYTQPTVCRTAEKPEFAKILAGRLWTSARSDMNGSTGTMGRTPVIRVYDISTPGSKFSSISPTEHVGAVTCGTVLPSQPHSVYVGHEGGFITVWSTDTSNGTPQCIEVVKVSVSDVLSLEGVNDRLWAGGRKGRITTYDVASRPWLVTNSWMAHNDLPVMKISVDYHGIRRMGRLRVVSHGRDEHIRFWDGLLREEWIDQELQKREASFSRFRNLTLLVISWNIDAARPDALADDPRNAEFLREALQSVDSPDIIAFGLQEIIDLESRKMTAKNVLLKKKDDGGLSEKVTTGYKKWHDQFLLAVRLAMPPDVPYTATHTDNLVGLFSCVLMKKKELATLQDVHVTSVKRGLGGRYGNKGAIISRFVIEDSSICLINCHLAAGQHHVRQRNADAAAIIEEAAFPASRSTQSHVAYTCGGDGSMIFDHEIIILNGDLNYRVDHRREPAIAAINSGEYETLFPHDQLMKEMKHNRGFRLRQFTEGPITFAPTYKYDRRSSEYDTSEKSRTPSWCDRVLWRSCVPSRVKQINYRRYEANLSDHRPISAGFEVTIKSVRHDVRANVRAEVEKRWIEHQESLLSTAHAFYVSQGLI